MNVVGPRMNVIGNAYAILLILFVLLGFAIGITITNAMMGSIVPSLNGVQAGLGDSNSGVYYDNVEFLMTNIGFLVYLMLLLIFYTSFGETNSLKSYVSMVIAGIIATVVFNQIGTVFWNYMSAQSSIIDFTTIGGSLWFIQNLGAIFIINLLISLCSFVFLKQPKQPGMSVTT